MAGVKVEDDAVCGRKRENTAGRLVVEMKLSRRVRLVSYGYL
jgi:hypothetical protein